jgi:hypothetical protein
MVEGVLPGGHLRGHPGGHLGGHPWRTPLRLSYFIKMSQIVEVFQFLNILIHNIHCKQFEKYFSEQYNDKLWMANVLFSFFTGRDTSSLFYLNVKLFAAFCFVSYS